MQWQQQFLDKGSSESCMPFSILGAKVKNYVIFGLGIESSRRRKFQAAKVPGPPMELSLPGAKVHVNEISGYPANCLETADRLALPSGHCQLQT